MEPTQLIETDWPTPRGTAVVVHGLNNKPEVMDGLVQVLAESGLNSLRVSLYDGLPETSAAPEEFVGSWHDAVSGAFNDAAHQFPGLPIYCVAYSIGALVTVSLLDQGGQDLPEKAVLLAPPFALKRGASLVRFLAPLGRFGLSLPSAAPKEIRARRGTPLAEYGAMISMKNGVQTLRNGDALGRMPTFIYLDSRDELVNKEGVEKWISENHLAGWRTMGFPNRVPEGNTYWHLVVTPESLGTDAWNTLVDEIVEFLEEPVPA